MLEMIRAKLVEVESFMEEMRKKDEQYAANEAERQKNEEQRIQDEHKNEENNLKNGFVYGKRYGLHFITKL